MLAVFTVNSNLDNTIAGDGLLTLREAIDDANQDVIPDIINFDATIFNTPQTILLTEGQLSITESVTIDATSLTNGLTIDAGGGADGVVGNGDGTRAFHLTNGNIAFAGLTITGGDTDGAGFESFGGGIFADLGTDGLRLDNVQLDNNFAGNRGGGLAARFRNGQALEIFDSTISNNRTRNVGGGIYHDVQDGSLTIVRSTISGNQVEGSGSPEGGGLYQYLYDGTSAVTITDSTFSHNSAETVSQSGTSSGQGGGAFFCIKRDTSPSSQINVDVTNSTFSGNRSGQRGGGLYFGNDNRYGGDLTATLSGVTITNNVSAEGAGLYSRPGNSDEQVTTTLLNSIVSDNRDLTGLDDNLAGEVDATSSYNLIGTGTAVNPTGAGNLFSDTPDLQPLAFYGGPTQTHMPNASSPVIDMGDPSFDVNGPDGVAFTADDVRYDQRGRGFLRMFDGSLIDIGAVEYGIGDPANLPTVVDIIISGSNSIHADYSFSEAFEKGIHEFQTVPVGGADTIEVVFSEWVDVVATDLWLYGNNDTTTTTYTTEWNVVDFAFDDQTFTARWRFDDPADGDSLPNPFPATKLVIGFNVVSVIQDQTGDQLDGFWDYPLSLTDPSTDSFPSGNGVQGSSFFFTFVIMPGDNDLTNTVTGSGFLWWQRHFDPNGTDNTFQDGDFDGDGDVDGADLALWQASFGLNFTSWWS